mgnify:CR=1 FL=1
MGGAGEGSRCNASAGALGGCAFTSGDRAAGIEGLADERQFFGVWRIRVVPLLHVGETVPERAVAGDLAIGAEAAGRHEGGAERDDTVALLR